MFPRWQPISTAPKDGTEILIFAEDEETTGNVLVSRWRNDTIPNGWAGSERPSHWLPLPLPPKVAKGAANGEVAAAMEG